MQIDRITPVDQSRADHFADSSSSQPCSASRKYEDAVRQALTMQSNLTLQQAREAMAHIDTGAKPHMATESAHAAGASCCWKCDSPGHLAPLAPAPARSRTSSPNATQHRRRRLGIRNPRPRPPPPRPRPPPTLVGDGSGHSVLALLWQVGVRKSPPPFRLPRICLSTERSARRL